jgi:hypothetical protein
LRVGAFSIPGKWFSSSRLILNSRLRAHRRTAPSGRSDFWILRACRPQLELRILRACLGQSKLWTSWACRACAAAQSCYNKREDRRLFVSAGTARSFAHLLPRKTCKAKLPALLLAFRPLEKNEPDPTVPRFRTGWGICHRNCHRTGEHRPVLDGKRRRAGGSKTQHKPTKRY